MTHYFVWGRVCDVSTLLSGPSFCSVCVSFVFDLYRASSLGWERGVGLAEGSGTVGSVESMVVDCN